MDWLIGCDFAAVCASYGAPLACRHERGVLYLQYESAGGAPFDAVQLVDGVVVAVADAIRRSATPCCGQEFVGRPIEQVLAALGRPLATINIGDSTQIEFADRVVTVHEGTVACIVPKAHSAATAVQ
jgi:hypothetical protein